jgi:KEOPS complex subunit Cgi121
MVDDLIRAKSQGNEHEFNCTIVAENLRISNVDDFLSALKAIAHTYRVTIQAVDAELIAGAEHIQSAVQKALRAMKRNRNITSELGLEILLYAAGKRQIERALEMGVRAGEQKVMIIIVDERGEKDLEVVAEEVKRKTGMAEVSIQDLKSYLDYDEHKKERIRDFFAITEDELNAVGEQKLKMLVLERVALVDVLK